MKSLKAKLLRLLLRLLLLLLRLLSPSPCYCSCSHKPRYSCDEELDGLFGDRGVGGAREPKRYRDLLRRREL